jgi:hypothetical protein
MATLPGAVVGSNLVNPDDLEGVPLLDARYTDDAAVQITIQDFRQARTFLDGKQWNLHWREADVLYQAPRTSQAFEGSTVARANVSRFTVAKHVNSLVPAMKSGIFYEMPPFLVRPRPATSQVTARAKTSLYGALLDEAGFEQTSELALESMTNFGTVICKVGWRKDTKIKKLRAPKAAPIKYKLPFGELTIHTKESNELVVTSTEVVEQGLTFEMCDLGSVFVDPTWNRANQLHKSAKYVVHLTYPTWEDLEKLRNQPAIFDEDGKKVGGYDIPSEEDLKAYFFGHEGNAGAPSQVMDSLNSGQNASVHHAQGQEQPSSEDPQLRPIMMLERHDREWIYTVLVPEGADMGVLIRKEEHELPFLPYVSSNFWNIPGAGYGMGVGRLAGNDQRIEKGLTDAVLDLLSFAVNQMYLRARGANAPTQQIRQRIGGIIDVDIAPGQKVTDVFGVLEMPKVPSEAFAVLQNATATAESTTGADQAFTQGNLPGKGSSAARTATGAGGIIAANAAKIQGPVGHFVQGILLPTIELLEFFVKSRMDPQEIRKTLGRELGDAFELDALNFYQSEDRFECLAGAHLAAKKAMAQALPLLVQIFENAPLITQLNAMGWMVDVKMLLEMFMEVSEWKDSRELIRRMNKQEAAQFQQNNSGQQKAQMQVAAIGARHQAKSEEIDQKAEADLATKMIGKANDQAALWDERKWDRDLINQSVFSPTGA